MADDLPAAWRTTASDRRLNRDADHHDAMQPDGMWKGEPSMRIGLFLPNWIGDVVMATPALAHLRNRLWRPCHADRNHATLRVGGAGRNRLAG